VLDIDVKGYFDSIDRGWPKPKAHQVMIEPSLLCRTGALLIVP
jgi:hypothetical protein